MIFNFDLDIKSGDLCGPYTTTEYSIRKQDKSLPQDIYEIKKIIFLCNFKK